MQRHHGNGGGLNIRDRQVNEGALGELEAANAETGSLNGVCTLPVSQCGVFALYSSRTGLCCSLVLWCSGVWLWCRRGWCVLASLAHNPLHRLSKAMNGGIQLIHLANQPHKGAVAPVIKPPVWRGRRGASCLSTF